MSKKKYIYISWVILHGYSLSLKINSIYSLNILQDFLANNYALYDKGNISQEIHRLICFPVYPEILD